jgi:hypothetical protein
MATLATILQRLDDAVLTVNNQIGFTTIHGVADGYRAGVEPNRSTPNNV